MNYYHKNRNQAVKNLKLGKPVWVNYSSTDCDGCSSQFSQQIQSVQEIIDAEESFERASFWADGPMSMWFVFDKYDALESYSGGQWGDC
jgi:hypothetical protein